MFEYVYQLYNNNDKLKYIITHLTGKLKNVTGK